MKLAPRPDAGMTSASAGGSGAQVAQGPAPVQNFYGMHDPAQTARMALMEQNREVRRAQARALHIVGPARPAAPKPAREASTRPVSTIERDPEVATFLRELFSQHRTVAQLRAACIARFGEARAPSLTRITIFRQRTR